jgi:hypothetical protein
VTSSGGELSHAPHGREPRAGVTRLHLPLPCLRCQAGRPPSSSPPYQESAVGYGRCSRPSHHAPRRRATRASSGIRVSVLAAIGSHIGDGGDAQSISLGVSFRERFGVVVNAERSYVPTDVTFFEDGYSASRGATTRFISGEFCYIPATYKRISPYVIGGVGRGVSRPNVNEVFPDRVTHKVTLQFPGFWRPRARDRTPECVRGHPVHVPEPTRGARRGRVRTRSWRPRLAILICLRKGPVHDVRLTTSLRSLVSQRLPSPCSTRSMRLSEPGRTLR